MNDVQKKIFSYEIPQSINPDDFGPATWNALHNIVENIPCSACRDEAASFMQFFHDLKNYQLGKKIMYKQNFVSWINKIASLKKQPLILK